VPDVTVTWTGIDKSKAKLDQLADSIRIVTPNAIDDVMDKLVRQTQTMLSLGQHRKGTKTGSVPPAPPWRISGDLRRAVKKQPARRVAVDVWSGQAGPKIVYGRIQELGGFAGRNHRTHLPARPYLKPAWRVTRHTVARTFVKRWGDATKSALK
jgi:hypothetical protein